MSWFAGCPSVGLLSGFVVDSGGHQDRGWVAILWRVLFPVRVNDVAHLGRKNLVSSSCGLGCCGWG